MNKVIACPIPVIAVIDGVAAAAGCQLVAMCDIAIATESSKEDKLMYFLMGYFLIA